MTEKIRRADQGDMMQEEALKDRIWQELKRVRYPGYDRDIVSSGLVQRVAVCDGLATVSLDMGRIPSDAQQEVVAKVRDAITPLAGLESLTVVAGKPVAARPRLVRKDANAASRPAGVGRVLAVGSGKGGVGKSTVTVNLAVALAQQGLRVGLMDADAYGPNIPRMMGVQRLPRAKDGMIQPAESHGVRMVSIGFMIESETPLVWRGPMTDKMVRQFLDDVNWGELDLLLVDLPPSTGDIPISLVKHTVVNGALVVVTPQEVALDDARKAVGLFRRLKVPILGVVENMSYFICDGCGTRHHLFGQGGGQWLAETSGVPFLGKVPMEPVVREGGDNGIPVVLRADSLAGQALNQIAERVWSHPELATGGSLLPGRISQFK
jgi:ATP-binding protein involved in chromosome partitioning